VFAVHLAEPFQPSNLASPQDFDATHDQLSQALQMDLPMHPITPSKIVDVIAKPNPKKAPGHDTICSSTIKALPRYAILYITFLFNAMVRLQYFPPQWKLGIISMINKPEEPVPASV